MANDKFDELEESVKSAQEYLIKNYDPHTIMIMQTDRVDVLSSRIGTPTPQKYD